MQRGPRVSLSEFRSVASKTRFTFVRRIKRTLCGRTRNIVYFVFEGPKVARKKRCSC